MKFFPRLVVLFLIGLFQEVLAQEPPQELAIYVSSGLLASGGLAQQIIPEFEKKEHCKVRMGFAGQGSQILSRLALESSRGSFQADLVLGVDQSLWEKIKPWADLWERGAPRGYSELREEVKLEPGFLPFGYGVLALMVDRKQLQARGLTLPKEQVISIQELLQPQWKRSLILEDPRSSTVGLGFLLFTQTLFGDRVWDFWKQLAPQWLTLAPGWEAAYGLFLRQEAPWVWSYLTSQAYHATEDTKTQGTQTRPGRYQAILFQEGQPLQIEGAVLLKKQAQTPAETRRMQLAQRFLEFFISVEVQKKIPLQAWMFPVRKSVALPAVFLDLPQPVSLMALKHFGKSSGKHPNPSVQQVLHDWKQAVTR
ncbi:MAG: thiamine ABC transporter substrate-binding protein [Bdellovibrionia bacterium]